jgi:arylsulfatase
MDEGGDMQAIRRTVLALANDRTEANNLAAREPGKVKELAAQWQAWADRVGVVPWEKLPGGSYKPSARYRKKSEPVTP